jgi:hypothetical protein
MAYPVYQFSYNGITFGNGTPYQIIDIDGLASQPDLRVQDVPRGYNDGYLTGRDFFNGRSIVFTLNIFAGNGNSAQTNYRLFTESMVPLQQLTSTNGVLRFNLDTAPSGATYAYKLNARVRNRKTKIDADYTYGFIRVQLEMFAPDWRYVSLTKTVNATIQPILANGRIYNRTYNLVYSQALIPSNGLGQASLDNYDGTATASPVFTVYGPITNPQITCYETGAYVRVNTQLADGDALIIDMQNNTVTLNGANARNLVTGGSQFWGVPSSSNYTVIFSAATSTGSVNIKMAESYA